ncbi:hypothetical protein [Amycolatopsis sp. NPDC059021]|uniref:hypothetical protein n=1 Tax=Amycolatopsis sp. NPDC059021 TaxID=3346704 RepID=UPI00367191DF
MNSADEKYQEDLDYFTDYARDDWVPINYIFVSASNIVGANATLQQITEVAERMFRDLFARSASVGDLTEREPGFQAWQGTSDRWLTRIRDDVDARGDLPAPGEFGWLHITE